MTSFTVANILPLLPVSAKWHDQLLFRWLVRGLLRREKVEGQGEGKGEEELQAVYILWSSRHPGLTAGRSHVGYIRHGVNSALRDISLPISHL